MSDEPASPPRGASSPRKTPAAPQAAPPQYQPPPPRSGLVIRQRLLRRLAGSTDTPVVALVAPAGYGKTTILAEWADRDPRPFAWITVEETDNDPLRLLSRVTEAVHEIESDDTEALAPSMTQQPKTSSRALERLARQLAERTTQLVLVLDDVHNLHDREAVAVLNTVAEHLPGGSQLVLAARGEPDLPLGRMRAHRLLAELRARDLAMTRSEAAKLLAATGVELEPEQVATLLDRTEGWPAALYIAALSLRQQGDVGRAVARFAGDDRMVTDYLRDEVLATLSVERMRFLTRTSVLDRLSGPLCDAVLERSGSGGVLREMSRSNLLLVPLDRNDEWYRYHTLLADSLRDELHRREPEHEAELHRRASSWYAEHQVPDRAIEHAVAAADAERAGELLWAAVPGYLPWGQVRVVQRWLDRFPEEEIAGHAALALTAAFCALNTGHGGLVQRWALAADSALQRAPRADRDSSLEAGVALLRAAVAREGVERMHRDATRAYDLQDADNPWRSVSCLFDGVARHLTGDLPGGRQRLEEGAHRAAIANAPDVQAVCLAQLALLGQSETEPSGDGSEAVQASALIERAGLTDRPIMAFVVSASAAHRAHRGEVDQAARDLRRAQRLLATLGDDYPSWYHAEARILLASAALSLSDVPHARKLLIEAERASHMTPDAVLLRELIDEVRGQAERIESSAPGAPSLTTAELRVLQLLTTHLSFREIAERLFVSLSTVKTQAHAVYRKLDASSRSEAVDHARARGLLEEEQGIA